MGKWAHLGTFGHTRAWCAPIEKGVVGEGENRLKQAVRTWTARFTSKDKKKGRFP